MDDDIIRIMVSSDNHLGFAERDPVRCDDAFASFEELLLTSRQKSVDFVLLGGDLFHENKPSRRSLFIAMELLRKYSLGDTPIYTEILNDQKEIFTSNCNSCVNYEDPYLSVSLPIYAIHGNHDDPSREGGQGESLAALDLLSINNMVNYFGKCNQIDDIEIVPILIRKKNTYVAIYGLGAIRDERLNRMWNMQKIKFIRPTNPTQNDGDSNETVGFFNILIIHQNRDYGRGSKNCIHESMIPEWMDIVIWGNEHESMPYLAESLVGTFRIFQPGSSIATSLVEGESSSCPKHMGMIEIRADKKFRLTPFRFTQIRPFIYKDISLNQLNIDNPNTLQLHDPKIDEKMKTYLGTIVQEMINEAKVIVNEMKNYNIDNLKYKLRQPNLALLSLRVDPTNYPTINQQRFGSQFVGKIANPSDLMIYSRKKKELHRRPNNNNVTRSAIFDENDENDEENIGSLGDNNKIKVEELVVQALGQSNRNLFILPECDLSNALEDYVKRKHANAFLDIVNETLEQTMIEVLKDCNIATHDAVIEATQRVKTKFEEQSKRGERQLKKKPNKVVYSDDDDEDAMAIDDDEDKVPKKTTAKAKKTTTSTDTTVKKPRKNATASKQATLGFTADNNSKLPMNPPETTNKRTARSVAPKVTMKLKLMIFYIDCLFAEIIC